MSSSEKDLQSSGVIRLNETTRIAHIPLVLPMAYDIGDGMLEIQPWEIFTTLGAFLALKHFNERSGEVLPHLPGLLKGCDLKITTSFYDSRASQAEASRSISEIMQHANNSMDNPNPIAIIGGAYSYVAKTAGILTGTFHVPLISPSASSSDLDNESIYPMFGRVVPDDTADAKITLQYLKSLGVKHVGMIHVRDPAGTSFAKSIKRFGAQMGMTTAIVVFERDDEESLRAAVDELKKSDFRYFIGTGVGEDEELLRMAYRAGIVGPDYAWLITVPDGVHNSTDTEIIEAARGTGNLEVDPIASAAVQQSIVATQFDTDFHDEFIATLKNLLPQLVVDFNLTDHVPKYSYWTDQYYDAFLIPAIAACSIDKEFFTNEELFDQIRVTEFQGASTYVKLDHDTANLDTSSYRYSMKNMIVSEPDVNGLVTFQKRTSSLLVNFTNQEINPFIYADNSTTPPAPLPPLKTVNNNFISSGVLATGLTLSTLVILASIGLIVFTYLYRKRKFIRGAQPQFLCLLSSGVIIMAASIIPMAMQEPVSQKGLNASCMAQLWLFSFGFTTTFSALFCKLWRLNRLFKSAKQFKRINVKPQDVILPFAALLSLNIILLTVWSTVDPLRWVRVDLKSYDEFDRVVARTASCSCESQTNQTIFYTFYFVLNLSALAIANWQSFLSWNVRTEFNESTQIMASMGILTEGAILGLPVLFIANDSPGAFFLVRAVLITVISFGVLVPIFVPKIALRNKKQKDSSRALSLRGSTEGLSVSFMLRSSRKIPFGSVLGKKSPASSNTNSTIFASTTRDGPLSQGGDSAVVGV